MSSDFEDIFHEYYAPLCNYAAKILQDDHAAEDLVQSLFIDLWENKKLAEVEKPGPFLLKSTKFKCIDYLRAKGRKKETPLFELPDHTNTPTSTIKEEDIEPLLYFFAAKLPPKTRAVFLMSRKEGKSYKEIADELEVSVKTVENQMGHALKKLRALLKEHHFLSVIFFL